MKPVHSLGHVEDSMSDSVRAFMRAEAPKKKAPVADIEAYHNRLEEYLEKEALVGRTTYTAYTDKCKTCPKGSMCSLSFEDDRPENERALTVFAMSPQCLPWTRGGARQGWAHKSIPSYLCAKHDQTLSKCDLGFCEEAWDMPMCVYSGGMLEKGYYPICVYFCGSVLGGLSSRPRFYGAIVNMETLVWVGKHGCDQTEVCVSHGFFCFLLSLFPSCVSAFLLAQLGPALAPPRRAVCVCFCFPLRLFEFACMSRHLRRWWKPKWQRMGKKTKGFSGVG